jgi:hypothetical protein
MRSVGGQLLDNSGHAFDVSASREVTAEQFDRALNYARVGLVQNYNLNDYNCTDFAIGVARAAGWQVPDTQGSWPIGHGSNPGDLGEDLR